jgi:CheY-like chemotaxis protein
MLFSGPALNFLPTPRVLSDMAVFAIVVRNAEGGMPASKRVLVVDDSRVQAKSLSMLLELMGHEVRLAYDGPTALEISAEFIPDVALIDVGLPGMNGYEVARRIREQPDLRHAVLIAQTGWGREEDREESRQAGFDHHLSKPLDHELLEKILAAPTEVEQS